MLQAPAHGSLPHGTEELVNATRKLNYLAKNCITPLQMGFDTKLDPTLGMAAVSSTTALFLHMHLPTATPPRLPDLTPGGWLQPPGPAAAANVAPSQRQPRPGDSSAKADGQLPHNDSGWSLVSAEDAADPAQDGAIPGAGSGTKPSGGVTPEAPSEATRTGTSHPDHGAANGSGRSDGAQPAALDPVAGVEADALGGRQGATLATPLPPKGGAFLPSGAELQAVSGGVQPSSSGKAGSGSNLANGTAAGAVQQRRSPAEASKIAVSEATKTAVAQLLGKLAAILELHARSNVQPCTV